MTRKQDIIYKTAKFFKKKKIILPKISELTNPKSIDSKIQKNLKNINKDKADPINLFRVHWHNKLKQDGFVNVPEFIVLPSELTGVDAKIIVNLGHLFPMIQAHKVLTAYGCLIPRIVNGNFNQEINKSVWPSTGNYCRGGVAISKILGCRSVAVLPEGMSNERFDWLKKWVTNKKDIVKTPGTESNVKEIYDTCKELEKNKNNIIINQFKEFDNYSIHRAVSGPAFEKTFLSVKGNSNLKPRLFVAASGSAGTLGAGDYLKEKIGSQIAVIEALECPTMLYNGYGEHNIQGIGDKHIPLIHNVMNSDYVVGISDKATNNLNLIFNTKVGKKYLETKKGLNKKLISRLPEMGFSAIANVLASIKLAKYLKLSSDEAIITVATDGAELYFTELEKTKRNFKGIFDLFSCAEIFGQFMKGTSTDNLAELSHMDKQRIFNLGYYTWVEQQKIEIADFEARKKQAFWDKKYLNFKKLDNKIENFNKLIQDT